MTATWNDYCSERGFAGPFENQVLYAMCRDNPRHESAYVTAGKVTAIGRIYAASPERGAGKSKEGNTLAGAIGERLALSKLDERVADIEFTIRFSSDVLNSVVDLHSYLVDEIVAVTRGWSHASIDEDWKPRNHASFTSKYLHFHRPNAFPIMDAFAKGGLNCAGQKGAFSTYRSFCEAFARHARTLDEDWTPRSVDTDLVARGRIHADKEAKFCNSCGYRRLKRVSRRA